jgi:hypothetical protein
MTTLLSVIKTNGMAKLMPLPELPVSNPADNDLFPGMKTPTKREDIWIS